MASSSPLDTAASLARWTRVRCILVTIPHVIPLITNLITIPHVIPLHTIPLITTLLITTLLLTTSWPGGGGTGGRWR